jgi:hypothetical protein
MSGTYHYKYEFVNSSSQPWFLTNDPCELEGYDPPIRYYSEEDVEMLKNHPVHVVSSRSMSLPENLRLAPGKVIPASDPDFFRTQYLGSWESSDFTVYFPDGTVKKFDGIKGWC